MIQSEPRLERNGSLLRFRRLSAFSDSDSKHEPTLIPADTTPSTSVYWPKFSSSLHLSTLPSMGRLRSAKSYPHPLVKVIKQTRAELFGRPLLLPSQISVVDR